MTKLPLQYALWANAHVEGNGEPRIVRLREEPELPEARDDALLGNEWTSSGPTETVILRSNTQDHAPGQAALIVHLPPELDYLASGDVLRINPAAQQVAVLYRRRSEHNSLLMTEQCNSFCVMCSQPPRVPDDGFLVDELLQVIPLMDPATRVLGITGGEPTLRFDRFLQVLRSIRANLPDTGVHVLSNGRLLSYTRYAQDIASMGLRDLQFGIPLYSDLAHRHDQVVQAAGAFDQTVRGILNLCRVGISVEIRVVVHRLTVERLPELARFIARNLPFVDHVALMGLEPMGFGKSNLDELWVDPMDYQQELDQATAALDGAGLRVSIYNHQLCTLSRSLWPFVVSSISDWKRYYAPECRECDVRDVCGGFFASSVRQMSRGICAVRKP